MFERKYCFGAKDSADAKGRCLEMRRQKPLELIGINSAFHVTNSCSDTETVVSDAEERASGLWLRRTSQLDTVGVTKL